MARPVEDAILVVDGEPDLLTTYRRLLGRSGFRIETATSRTAALEALARGRFVAVISDVRLPDGDGLDVVRAAGRVANPPTTIVVSGVVSSGVRKAALDAGANAFFVKPFQAAALTAEIRALIADRPRA